MPRNCGCTDKCSCVIRQGAGIEVTGTGRPENPYVVTATGGGEGGGGGFDTGDVKWTARPSAPAGWLVCDGASVSRTTYDDLFAAIGTTYGPGDGATTFTLPDYTGRFILGADGDHLQGSSGGAEEQTLTVEQMPAHNHTVGRVGDHSHGMRRNDADGATANVARLGSTTGDLLGTQLVQPAGGHTHSLTETGGGLPLSVMPPYGTALPLIKT